MSEIKDFTEDRSSLKPKQFRIDDDLFECAPLLPAGATTYLASMMKADDVQRVVMLGELLDMIVLPESAQRFAARLKDPLNPISNNQLGAIVKWMLEEYGLFPTQQSSNSAPGPTPTGMNSMAGALHAG